MQHIVTKYLGQTTFKPARICGHTSEGLSFGRVTESRSIELSTTQQHARVAQAVMRKMGWQGEIVGDEFTPNEMVWFFADSVTHVRTHCKQCGKELPPEDCTLTECK